MVVSKLMIIVKFSHFIMNGSMRTTLGPPSIYVADSY